MIELSGSGINSVIGSATKCVTAARRDGIYTMLIGSKGLEDFAVRRMVNACRNEVERSGDDRIKVVAVMAVASTTLSKTKVAIIAYDSTRPNPYLTYTFRHDTIIIRDNRRGAEQTVQLILDAQRQRSDLDDLILHQCTTRQFGVTKFLIVICRGEDNYRRVFYRDGRKQALHVYVDRPVEEPTEQDESPRQSYMVRCLLRYGNTVADPAVVKRRGTEGTERWLSQETGLPVSLRPVAGTEGDGDYYIAEVTSYENI